MRPAFPAVALTTILSLAATAARGESVDHPLYRSWAAYPVGTTITLRSVTEGTGRTIETTKRSTLKALDPQKAVIEMVSTSDATGESIENQPQEFTIRREFPLLPGVKAEDVGKPTGIIASGTEEIEVAGQTYQAVWYDSKGNTEAGPSLTRTWLSDRIPGRVLRSVTRVPAVKKVTTEELVEIRMP